MEGVSKQTVVSKVCSEGGLLGEKDGLHLHTWVCETDQTLTVMGTRFATAIWKSKQCVFQFPNLIDHNQRDCKFHACP